MYELVRSSRRSIAIEIKDDASVVVRAPRFAPEREIARFVDSKRDWIAGHQDIMKAKRSQSPRREFADGEEQLYLGRGHPLRITHGGDRALVFRGLDFLLSPDHAARAREFFTGWYKEEAHKVIRQRLDIYSPLMGLRYSGIRITGGKRRWGSCARTGRLTFSWRLILAPLEVIDYVVVHELTHIEQMDHSKRFWQKVEAICPDYKTHKQWLHENAHKLMF